jgi:membrane protein implicated in regulation of membrane protease activity
MISGGFLLAVGIAAFIAGLCGIGYWDLGLSSMAIGACSIGMAVERTRHAKRAEATRVPDPCQIR